MGCIGLLLSLKGGYAGKAIFLAIFARKNHEYFNAMKQATHSTPQKPFSGLSVALVTPFDDHNKIDFCSLELLLKRICGHVENIVLFGTSGESPTIHMEERHELLRFAKEKVKGQAKLILGLGSNDTTQLVQRLEQMDPDIVDGILSVVPYYNKPNATGIYRHFATVAQASPLPIIIYNIPSRTGVNLSIDTLLRLRDTYPKQIVGIKEASGATIPERVTAIKQQIDKDFTILSGDDQLNLQAMQAGADGAISVVANAFPELTQATLHISAPERAQKVDNALEALYKLLFCEGNPTGIKALLHALGILTHNTLRLPLVEASESLYHRLQEEATRLSALIP